jgi:hypothetical protein
MPVCLEAIILKHRMTYFLVRSTGKKERKRVLMERRLYE